MALINRYLGQIAQRASPLPYCSLTVLLAVLPNTLHAQEPAPVSGQTAVAATVSFQPADVAAIAEEIVVLRALKSIRLTPTQLATLAPGVSGAQEKLAQQAQADQRIMATLQPSLLQARRQLLPPGLNLDDPRLAQALLADQQVTAAQRTAAQNQSRVRDEQIIVLKRQLQSLLTPAQAAAIVGQGRALIAAERAERDRQFELRRQQVQQAFASRGAQAPMGQGGSGGPGGRGGPGGNDGERTQRMMERLREADADEYQRMSSGMARRFGDEGTPAYQKAKGLFDRVRSMPNNQFRRQRAGLAEQFRAGITAPRTSADPSQTISAENGIDTWVRRYLLSAQAPAALKGLSAPKSEP